MSVAAPQWVWRGIFARSSSRGALSPPVVASIMSGWIALLIGPWMDATTSLRIASKSGSYLSESWPSGSQYCSSVSL